MKISLILLSLLGTAVFAQAQYLTEKGVPAAVKSAFHKLHPDVRSVDWERATPYFEAIFTLRKAHRAIKFDLQGRVAETETGFPVEQLMPAIAKYMNSHYPRERVQAAEKVTQADGSVSYEIRITGMEVVFDAAGKYLEEEKD